MKAKKFVQLIGLNQVFNVSDFPSASAIKHELVDGNSIIFITCSAEDAALFGMQYAENTQWLWAKGKMYGASDTNAILTEITGADTSVVAGDSIKTAIGKLQQQVTAAKAGGVQSIMGSDSSWINFEPNEATTGQVEITVEHKLVDRIDDSSVEDSSFQFVAVSGVKSDAAGHITGQTLKTFKLPVETSLSTSDEKIPTSNAVKVAIDDKVASAVHYLGTVASAAEVTAKTQAVYGDFARASQAFTLADSSVHASDMIILDSSAPGAAALEASWKVVHGERDSWRAIQINGTELIAASDATELNVSAGNMMNITADGKKMVIAANIPDASTAHKGIVQLANVITYTDPEDDEQVVIDSSAEDKAATALGLYRLYDEMIKNELVTSTALNIHDTSINILDASIKAMNVTDAQEENKYVVAVNQVDGKIEVTKATLSITHQTSKNVVGSTDSSITDGEATNGNVWLNHVEDSTVTSHHKIEGAGFVSVISNAAGNITIDGSINNATEEIAGIVKITDSSTSTATDTAISAKSFGELYEEVIRNEEVVAAAINDIYDKMHESSDDDWAIIGA